MVCGGLLGVCVSKAFSSLLTPVCPVHDASWFISLSAVNYILLKQLHKLQNAHAVCQLAMII